MCGPFRKEGKASVLVEVLLLFTAIAWYWLLSNKSPSYARCVFTECTEDFRSARDWIGVFGFREIDESAGQWQPYASEYEFYFGRSALFPQVSYDGQRVRDRGPSPPLWNLSWSVARIEDFMALESFEADLENNPGRQPSKFIGICRNLWESVGIDGNRWESVGIGRNR